MFSKILTSLLISFFLLQASLTALSIARIDTGPAYLKIDLLEKEKIRKTIRLNAFKFDGSIGIGKGFCLKPSFLYADKKTYISTYSLGLGYNLTFIPMFCFTPHVGVSRTSFKTPIHIPEYTLAPLKECFLSYGKYIGLDITWNIIPGLRMYGGFQYIWSRVKTTVKPLFISHNNTEGPSYGLVIEKDLGTNFSLSLSYGYNLSLSEEKHGLKGQGVKFGCVYWY